MTNFSGHIGDKFLERIRYVNLITHGSNSRIRGISLLSVSGKVFAKILDAGICQVTEGQVMEEQAGFRVGRGCRDQVLVVRQLGEKTIEKDGKMYAAFIDLEKA